MYSTDKIDKPRNIKSTHISIYQGKLYVLYLQPGKLSEIVWVCATYNSSGRIFTNSNKLMNSVCSPSQLSWMYHHASDRTCCKYQWRSWGVSLTLNFREADEGEEDDKEQNYEEQKIESRYLDLNDSMKNVCLKLHI